MTDHGTETRIVEIGGRSVVVRQLRDVQLTLLAREAKQIQKSDVEGSRRVDAAARMFDILESAVVQETDRDYLLDEITAGNLEFKDLLNFISAFTEQEKPKVRRGRPPAVRS
jgi:hypothetical protein